MTTVEIELDDARELMYDELSEMFAKEAIDETLEEQLIQHLTQMYDNREELQEMEQENGNV